MPTVLSLQVCEPQAYRHPGSRWNISIEERRRQAMLYAQERTNMEMAQSRDLLGVCQTAQQTVSSPPTCPDPTPPCQAPEMVVPLQDIRQMVAELVSEGVERDILLPHPSSTECPTAFRDYLARRAPLWQNKNFED